MTANQALKVLPAMFAVCRLESEAPVPDWATGEVASITRTPDELSIVCRQDNVPQNIRSETGGRCFQVVGPLEFSMVGVIASITGPLASANISVFVVSTFDTDYLLVKEADLGAAVASLTSAGHPIES